MRPMPSTPPAMMAMLLVALASLSCAHGGGGTSWHEVTGADFELRSCVAPETTLELAKSLRETHAVLSQLVPAVPARDTVPFRAHVFCRGGDFIFLKPKPAQANHYVLSIRDSDFDATYEADHVAWTSRPRGTQLAARGGQIRINSDLIRHHYVHHLLRAHADLPIWIEEGLASFLGTTRIEAEGVRVGRAAPAMDSLRRLDVQIPLGRTFRATDLRAWPLDDRIWFYRGAWLVLHYLHFGRLAADDLPGPRLQRFAETFAATDDEEEASQQAFDEGPTGLRKSIDRYIRTRSQRLRNGEVRARKDGSPARELATRPLSEHDAACGLGELALGNGDAAEASKRFERALATDPGSARAQSGLARALALANRWDDATRALETADRLAPNSSDTSETTDVLLDGARVLIGRSSTPSGTREDLAQARTRAERALDARPDSAEAHYLIALTHVGSDEKGMRLAALESAHSASPGNIEIGLALAETLSKNGRIPDARSLAERLAGWTLGEKRKAKALRQFLDDLPSEDRVATSLGSGS